VGWQPIGRRCSWWPTGAAPTSLIPVVAVVFHLRFVRCHNKGIFIYLFHTVIMCPSTDVLRLDVMVRATLMESLLAIERT